MKNNFWLLSVMASFLILVPRAQADAISIEQEPNASENDSKSYCTPILGQQVYKGTVVTVPVGHDCSSWLNYRIQQEINEKNIELKREENQTNARLQLYLNRKPQW